MCPKMMMQRWTLDEICASACCPGCGCEVTSNYCMACRYANMNALTTRREIADKDSLLVREKINDEDGESTSRLRWCRNTLKVDDDDQCLQMVEELGPQVGLLKAEGDPEFGELNACGASSKSAMKGSSINMCR